MGSTGPGGSPGSGGDGGTDLTPASNIDVTTCAAIRASDPYPSSSYACWTCCKAQPGNMASSFIYKSQCTCAAPRDDEGKTICASATADGNACAACCGDHDYVLSGWVGADATTAAQCGCSNLQDSTVCAASARSESACESCCQASSRRSAWERASAAGPSA